MQTMLQSLQSQAAWNWTTFIGSFKFFGDCSGLKVNISKIEIFPIRLNESMVHQLIQNFPDKICKFLGKNLGLPLHVRKLRRVDVQPLIDKIGYRGGKVVSCLSTAGKH